MIQLSQDKILYLHEIIARETGGDAGVRDAALLDSALEAPFQTFGGEALYPTLEEKAARLGYALIANHAFLDGNKRIGMYVLLVFLRLNGVRFRPSVEEGVRVGLAVAAGEMGYDALLSWIRENK